MKEAFNKKKILKLINSKKIISFDVFDTLIKRNCKKPTDIFDIVEKRYNSKYNTKIENFLIKRKNAEKLARQKTKEEDITLNEIYQYIEYKKEVANKLKELEIEVELDYCQKNHNMYEIYQYCIENNKTVICISDMYLTKDIISKILYKNDFNINKIYVSSEYKKTKLKGTLFEEVINQLKINKKDMLHIGDSYKADVLGPIKKGIRAFHINKFTENTTFLNIKPKENYDLTTNIMLSVTNNNVVKYNDYYEKIGYEILGPLCCSISYWLNDTSKKNGITNLLFCARDMKMLQEIYNNLFKEDLIKNSYFYVSRKSTYLPFLYLNQEYKYFQELIPIGKRQIKINELLELYNITDKNYEKNLKTYDLEPKKEYDLEKLKNSEKFKKYYQEIILKIIDNEGKIQYQNFMQYLNQLSVDKNTAIVDLGWRGTTQKIMIDIVNHNINGFYFGLHSKNNKYHKNNYWTYLFDGKENKYSEKVYSFMTIVEMLFSALHGSTIKYSSSKKEPYILNKSVNENNEYITKIQTGALNYCKDLMIYKNDLNYSKNTIFVDELIKLGTKPTLRQANILGELYTENIKVRAIAKPQKLFFYIFNIKKLKKDLLDSEWKIGFMKRLLKLNLPYYKIYLYLKRNN